MRREYGPVEIWERGGERCPTGRARGFGRLPARRWDVLEAVPFLFRRGNIRPAPRRRNRGKLQAEFVPRVWRG